MVERPAREDRRISAREIERIKEAADLVELVRGTTGEKVVRQGREFIARCPVHGGRALRVIPEKSFAYCHACSRSWDPISWLVDHHSMTFREAVAALGGDPELEPSPEAIDAARRRREDEEVEREKGRQIKRAAAWRLWASAAPIDGTPAEAYLLGRGLVGPWPASLRFHPRLTCNFTDADGRDRSRKFPALLAAVQASDGRFATVHRIYLSSADGERWGKAEGVPAEDVKKLHGSPVDGAIRLGGDVAAGLHLAEGIETALAVRQAVDPRAAVWSVISAGQLLRVAFGPGRPRWVAIWADYDRKSGTGEAKARQAVERFKSMNIPATFRFPPSSGSRDWLDELTAAHTAA